MVLYKREGKLFKALRGILCKVGNRCMTLSSMMLLFLGSPQSVSVSFSVRKIVKIKEDCKKRVHVKIDVFNRRECERKAKGKKRREWKNESNNKVP